MKQLFPALSTHWDLCVSNRVLRGQVRITGKNIKILKRSLLHTQTNTLTVTVISLMQSKKQFNFLLTVDKQFRQLHSPDIETQLLCLCVGKQKGELTGVS